MVSDYIVKAVAWLLSIAGAACVVAGLTFGGILMALFGVGLMTSELEDEIQ